MEKKEYRSNVDCYSVVATYFLQQNYFFTRYLLNNLNKITV